MAEGLERQPFPAISDQQGSLGTGCPTLAPLQALEPPRTWAQATQPLLALAWSEFWGWDRAWGQRPTPDRVLMSEAGKWGHLHS